MKFPKTYKLLSNNIFSYNEYSLVPIRYEHRYEIMSWRNQQIYHLRQNKLLTKSDQDRYFKNVDRVYHFAANADVRFGLKHRKKDINQNILVTYRILETIKKNKINELIFSSTGSIYGEATQIPTKENSPFPIQTSLYGASKASAEAIISAYSEAYELKSYIFRFVSILGNRYTHGHVFDFIKKLKKNKNVISILGDGNQKKSYLHVDDCIRAIDLGVRKN